MRIVLQRVLEASVQIEGKVYAEIEKGLLIFIGIKITDSKEDIQ